MRSERGIGLLEMVIAMAMAGISIYTVLIIIDSVEHQQAYSKQTEARSSLMSLLFTLGDRASPMVRFQDFRTASSFWRGDNVNLLATLVLPHGMTPTQFKSPAALGGATLYRDSWTMEISKDLEMRRAQTNQGFLISRCIPKNEASRTNFDVQTILSYQYFPVLLGTGTGINGTKVQCCRVQNNALNNCNPMDLNSLFRVRLFQGTANSLRVYPQPQDRRYVSGAGMFAYFNRADTPDLLNIHMFTVDNECQRVADFGVKSLRGECSNADRFDGKIIQRGVVTNVHESGILQLGR